MGQTVQLGCTECGYRVRVSGGFDRGMLAYTATVSCKRCSQLGDIRISELLHEELINNPREVLPEDLRCLHCKSKRITRWTIANGCPKCKHPMEDDGCLTCYWD